MKVVAAVLGAELLDAAAGPLWREFNTAPSAKPGHHAALRCRLGIRAILVISPSGLGLFGFPEWEQASLCLVFPELWV